MIVKNSLKLLKMLKYSNTINNSWNGFNVLNSTLNETTTALYTQIFTINKY